MLATSGSLLYWTVTELLLLTEESPSINATTISLISVAAGVLKAGMSTCVIPAAMQSQATARPEWWGSKRGRAIQTARWQQHHPIPTRVEREHKEEISERRDEHRAAGLLGEQRQKQPPRLRDGTGGGNAVQAPREPELQRGLPPQKTGVLKIRAAGGSGSRSETRQCEFALVV